MTDPIVVVGSGASGVHFAQSALEAGRRVTMIDVGRAAPPPELPEVDFAGLRSELDDPVRYFLGEDYGSLILPGHGGEYYGFPPTKRHVFAGAESFRHRAVGFAPLLSFAAGGLAEAWTGGCYPFSDAELGDFPFGLADIRPFYELVARRIGVAGLEDDLAPFFDVHGDLSPPLELDQHGEALMERYQRHRATLHAQHRCYLGRARLAVLSEDRGVRKGCAHLGRCLWGCPVGALYTPSITLRELMDEDGFSYQRGLEVTHFSFGDGGRVDKVVAQTPDGAAREIPVGTLVLAAGTLCTSKIFLESIRRGSGEELELTGLTDNRQILMPFLNTAMLGVQYEPASYQYHQLAFALDADQPHDHVHGLVTTLKTAMIHPVVQSMPASVGAALSAFKKLHAALGLVNINMADRRRDRNRVFVEPSGDAGESRLVVHYEPEPDEARRLAEVAARFRKILRTLGCIAPRAMTHVRPMGASVHYSGTLPMSEERRPMTVDENGRSRDFENLYVVDGSVFPSLPAKNLTFTLMANAARVGATLG